MQRILDILEPVVGTRQGAGHRGLDFFAVESTSELTRPAKAKASIAPFAAANRLKTPGPPTDPPPGVLGHHQPAPKWRPHRLTASASLCAPRKKGK